MRKTAILPGILLMVAPLRADIRISEIATTNVVGKKVESIRSIAMQGGKMRTEVRQGNSRNMRA